MCTQGEKMHMTCAHRSTEFSTQGVLEQKGGARTGPVPALLRLALLQPVMVIIITTVISLVIRVIVMIIIIASSWPSLLM